MNNLQKAKAFDQAAADLIRYGWIQGNNGDSETYGEGPRCAGQAIRSAGLRQLSDTDTITIQPSSLYRTAGFVSGSADGFSRFIQAAIWQELEPAADKFVRENSGPGGYLHDEMYGTAKSFVAWQDLPTRTIGQVVGVLIDIAHTLRTMTDTTTTPATVFGTTKPDKLIEEPISDTKILTGYGSGV